MKRVKEFLRKYIVEGDKECLEKASILYKNLGGEEGDKNWCKLVNSIDLEIK